MCSQKRESSSIQESVLEKSAEITQQASLGNENVGLGLEPSKKKSKKEEKRKDTELFEGENENDTNAASTSSKAHKVSLNSMERRKHRKLQDKEKHKSKTKKIKPGPEKIVLDPINDGNESAGSSNSSGGSVLPQFHISVFKDLAAADASVREAAAKKLVTELREVQNAYEKLENKDEVEDRSMLEAEKDDGLYSCAPSVRYAVRRLIHGVSSSREEARDDLLGRLFAYGAVTRSGRLTEEWISDNNTPLIKEFTGCLIALVGKKRYLQEYAVAVILEMVEKFPVEAITSHVLEAPDLQQWFEGEAEAGNPDALLLALKLQGCRFRRYSRRMSNLCVEFHF